MTLPSMTLLQLNAWTTYEAVVYPCYYLLRQQINEGTRDQGELHVGTYLVSLSGPRITITYARNTRGGRDSIRESRLSIHDRNHLYETHKFCPSTSESDFHFFPSSCHRQIYTTNAYTKPITILTQLLLITLVLTLCQATAVWTKTSHLCFMSLRWSSLPVSLRHLFWCKQVSCVYSALLSLFVRSFFPLSHTLRRWQWTLTMPLCVTQVKNIQ